MLATTQESLLIKEYSIVLVRVPLFCLSHTVIMVIFFNVSINSTTVVCVCVFSMYAKYESVL